MQRLEQTLVDVSEAAIAENGWGMGAIMNAWRLLLVGAAKGPGLFDLAAYLGREEVLSRMTHGIQQIKK